MREPPEIIETDQERVACDGGDDALGHPRVYLVLGEDGRVECPYCDRLFHKPGAAPPQAAPGQGVS